MQVGCPGDRWPGLEAVGSALFEALRTREPLVVGRLQDRSPGEPAADGGRQGVPGREEPRTEAGKTDG